MNQSICSSAYKLVKESLNTQILGLNTNTINELIDEISKDYESFYLSIGGDNKNEKDYRQDQKVLIDKVNRNKRAVLIYLNERIKKLIDASWTYSTNLPNYVLDNLDENDNLFYSEYTKNLHSYSSKLSYIDMDLTKHLHPPSDSIMVSIRAEENIKNFKLNSEQGIIEIHKGNTYYFPKADVESYVKRGVFSYNE